ncbi:hypothetical protein BDR07DRAFT_1381526 [Suillus spraguei]|nr:hypothetical protein BDR07DRAFT_1381526 [Suillus spraguei]
MYPMTSDNACGTCVKDMRSLREKQLAFVYTILSSSIDVVTIWAGRNSIKVPETFCDNVASIQIKAPVLDIYIYIRTSKTASPESLSNDESPFPEGYSQTMSTSFKIYIIALRHNEKYLWIVNYVVSGLQECTNMPDERHTM